MLGKQILNYRIESLLGEGGMGNVYLGLHTHLNRKVAVKALHPVLARNFEIRERFKNEASALSQLNHPNIVALHDYIEQDNEAYLVMEFVDGIPLDEYIQKVSGPIPEEKAIKLFTQILDGVAYAHSKNIIHRDVKPSNFLVTNEGIVKILDFGIAKILSETSHKLTKTGAKIGTILYMSPEQIKGLVVDKKTDIYSLGVTLFQMLSGKCPYDESSTEYEISKKIVEEPLPRAKDFYICVSARMQSIIDKATAKNPTSRFSDCDEFKKYLLNKNEIASQSIRPPAKETGKHYDKKSNKVSDRKKNTGVYIALSAVALIILIIIIVVASQNKSTSNNSANSNTEATDNAPLLIAKQFLIDLGNQDYSSAYNNQNNPDWGSLALFTSKFNTIRKVDIQNSYIKSQDTDNAVVFIEVLITDKTTGSGLTLWNEDYYLTKYGNDWKISKLIASVKEYR